MRPSKPTFQSVVDLGLRDLGVRNEPRRLAAHFGKATIALFALLFLILVAACVVLSMTGAPAWILAGVALASTAGVLALAFRTAKRAPVVVVKVTAGGANQAVWMVIAPLVLLVIATALAGAIPMLIIAVVLTSLMTLAVWKGRGHVPGVLGELRSYLAADEAVEGDGVGLIPGSRWQEAMRVVAATDRRLIVAASPRSPRPLVDAPYSRISRFGIEWKYWGQVGTLSFTVTEEEDAPSEAHLIGNIAPANLVSIARALRSHGVQADNSEAVAEAERGWEAALRPQPREPVFDRAAMRSRDFDRGLWLLLALCAVALYLNPFGVGLGPARDAAVGVLVIVPILCAICGYASGTKASLAYLVPLNLLVAPAFFFVPPGEVIALMIVMSALAAMALWVGQALRGARATRAKAERPERSAARGSARAAVSGVRLIRITAALLATVAALTVVSSAVGFDFATLRAAFGEATDRQTPVDGRSNLTGGDASLTYTPGPDLKEFITDEDWGAGPNDGARWELRSSFGKGYNLVSLSHYVFVDPRLDDPAAVSDFVAGKDREHARLAGYRVGHRKRVVDGRQGYVWNHGTRRGYWHYTAWFPEPVHTVRVECIAKRDERRFRRLCAEAMSSLEFH